MLGLIPKKKQDIDIRDLQYSTVFKVSRQERRVILDVLKILNQLKFGTCTAFAMSYAIIRLLNERMSELYNYIKAKEIDTFQGQEGTTLHFINKAYKEYGSVPEHKFPYSQYKLPLIFPEIPKEIIQEALENRIDAYVKITTPEELTDHLLHGNFAVGGFAVGLKSLFNPEHLANGDAVLDVPGGVPGDTLAGHAMAIVGIDWDMTYNYKNGRTRTRFVKAVNSWGTEDRIDEFTGEARPAWSRTGYVWIPFDYVFGTMYAPDGSQTPYVNEIFIPLKDIPFKIKKIDGGNEDVRPYIKNNRTMVPLRFIGEALGMNVLYHEHDKGITISDNGLIVKLNIESRDMQVNNKFIKLDAPPEIKESRTFVPLRAVAEAFDCTVDYYPNEKRIVLKKGYDIIELWIGLNEARIITKE